jgi:hypothetical protein
MLSEPGMREQWKIAFEGYIGRSKPGRNFESSEREIIACEVYIGRQLLKGIVRELWKNDHCL